MCYKKDISQGDKNPLKITTINNHGRIFPAGPTWNEKPFLKLITMI